LLVDFFKVRDGNESPPVSHLISAPRTHISSEAAHCHNEGEEGAPALIQADAWADRIRKGKTLLIRNAIEGSIGNDGEMSARGGTESLIDDQVAAAVRYLLACLSQASPTNHDN
jgi:cytochrome c5